MKKIFSFFLAFSLSLPAPFFASYGDPRETSTSMKKEEKSSVQQEKHLQIPAAEVHELFHQKAKLLEEAKRVSLEGSWEDIKDIGDDALSLSKKLRAAGRIKEADEVSKGIAEPFRGLVSLKEQLDRCRFKQHADQTLTLVRGNMGKCLNGDAPARELENLAGLSPSISAAPSEEKIEAGKRRIAKHIYLAAAAKLLEGEAVIRKNFKNPEFRQKYETEARQKLAKFMHLGRLPEKSSGPNEPATSMAPRPRERRQYSREELRELYQLGKELLDNPLIVLMPKLKQEISIRMNQKVDNLPPKEVIDLFSEKAVQEVFNQQLKDLQDIRAQWQHLNGQIDRGEKEPGELIKAVIRKRIDFLPEILSKEPGVITYLCGFKREMQGAFEEGEWDPLLDKTGKVLLVANLFALMAVPATGGFSLAILGTNLTYGVARGAADYQKYDASKKALETGEALHEAGVISDEELSDLEEKMKADRNALAWDAAFTGLDVLGLGQGVARTLDATKRIDLAGKILSPDPLKTRALSEFEQSALLRAHDAKSLREKAEILNRAGFSREEREKILRSGLAGLPVTEVMQRVQTGRQPITTRMQRAADETTVITRPSVPSHPAAFSKESLSEIDAALRSSRSKAGDLSKNLYAYGTDSAAGAIGFDAKTPQEVASFLGVKNFQMTSWGSDQPMALVNGKIGPHGVSAHGKLTWLSTSFREPPKDASFHAKIYVSLPPELISQEIVGIADLAKKNGALAVKFAFKNPGRPDRIVIHFTDPEMAAETATVLAKRFREKGLLGDRVPFTHPVGNGKTPVSMGVDPIASHVSWRDHVTTAIAAAEKECVTPPKDKCIAEFLWKSGIDPNHWLPVGDIGERISKITARNLDAQDIGVQGKRALQRSGDTTKIVREHLDDAATEPARIANEADKLPEPSEKEIINEAFSLIPDYLRSNNVAFTKNATDDGDAFLQMVPTKGKHTHPLNRYAAALKAKYGVDLKFDPKVQLEGADAAYQDSTKSMFISLREMKELRVNPAGGHEIRHAVHGRNLDRGDLSLFDGSVFVPRKGSATVSAHLDSAVYKGGYHFDELDAYAYSVRTAKDPQDLFSYADTGGRLSRATADLTAKALKRLDDPKAVSFYIADGKRGDHAYLAVLLDPQKGERLWLPITNPADVSRLKALEKASMRYEVSTIAQELEKKGRGVQAKLIRDSSRKGLNVPENPEQARELKEVVEAAVSERIKKILKERLSLLQEASQELGASFEGIVERTLMHQDTTKLKREPSQIIKEYDRKLKNLTK